MGPSDHASVFQRYRREVYGWAYRLLGRHHDALDAAQDVFLRWIDQAARQTPDNPRGWLRQVTINRAIDLLRCRRRAEQTAESDVIPVSAAADPVEREELRQDIVKALEGLTEAQRSVLVAKVYDEMTFAQIAAEQGLAVPTVKTHYLRALSAVRDRLAPRWRPERDVI